MVLVTREPAAGPFLGVASPSSSRGGTMRTALRVHLDALAPGADTEGRFSSESSSAVGLSRSSWTGFAVRIPGGATLRALLPAVEDLVEEVAVAGEVGALCLLVREQHEPAVVGEAREARLVGAAG